MNIETVMYAVMIGFGLIGTACGISLTRKGKGEKNKTSVFTPTVTETESKPVPTPKKFRWSYVKAKSPSLLASLHEATTSLTKDEEPRTSMIEIFKNLEAFINANSVD